MTDCVCVYLIEVLIALVGEGDGDREDGVGGVLVETCLTVSSKQSQSPAPANTQTHTQYVPGSSADFYSLSVASSGGFFRLLLLPEQREDAAGSFVSNQPGDVVKRLHSERKHQHTVSEEESDLKTFY